MKYPEFLKEKGTIGFVAPSFGASIEPYKSAFDNAQKKLKKKGYQLELGPNCYEGCGIGISNTPEKCGAELTEYYCADTNDVLISCGGGELMSHTIDCVDFDKIKAAKPKWYMGYSDNTNFTFLLTTMCDTASIYGPNAPAFGQEPWHESLQDALDVLHGKNLVQHGYEKWEKESLKDKEHPLEPYNVTEPRKLVIYTGESKVADKNVAGFNGTEASAKVSMKGRLIGGCMDILAALVGTNYDHVAAFAEKYKEDGIIWYMEACDLNMLGIRRALWQLDHAGWFKYVKGFVFGRPYFHGEELFGMDQYNAVTGILSKYNVPIIMDADIGHIPPMMPLINGSYASVEADDKTIEIKMELR